MFESLVNPVFNPLLRLGPLATVIILSFLVSVLMVFIYKWMTNQDEMKIMKRDIKKYQKQMREYRKEPEKMMAIQKKVTALNMKYLKESFKPTLVTFIPIIIIFGWMNAHLYYEPISPGDKFDVDVFLTSFNKGGVLSVDIPEGIEVIGSLSKDVSSEIETFSFKGSAGEYWLSFSFLNDSVQKNVIISDDLQYAPPIENFEDKSISQVVVKQERLKVLFGLSWLWTYIIFAVFLSMFLRKLLKVY